jgi:hypothetical protein
MRLFASPGGLRGPRLCSTLAGLLVASSGPVLTPDGRFVVFVSAADNLVANDHNDTADVFVRDRFERRTVLVSLNSDGTRSGNGPSTTPGISAVAWARPGRSPSSSSPRVATDWT